MEDVSLCFELGRATIVVRDDQLSLAIGRRGQNVRLAARLTGWDIDILTPDEYTKGLETLWEALKEIDGVTEEMLDRMAAMGIISVFDVEEIGRNVMVTDLEIEDQVADRCVESAIMKSKEVTLQREVEKEAEEARALEEEAAAAAVLDGKIDDDAEAAADSILGLDAPVEESTIENEAVVEDEEAVVVTDSEQTEQTDTTA